jgi:hypothetical protein
LKGNNNKIGSIIVNNYSSLYNNDILPSGQLDINQIEQLADKTQIISVGKLIINRKGKNTFILEVLNDSIQFKFFNKIVNEKKSQEEMANRNITQMVFAMIFIYFVCYTPYTLRRILRYAFEIQNSAPTFDEYMKSLSFTIMFIGKGSLIIIYYRFNKEYKKCFDNLIKIILRKTD